jgi:hypothetical protein
MLRGHSLLVGRCLTHRQLLAFCMPPLRSAISICKGSMSCLRPAVRSCTFASIAPCARRSASAVRVRAGLSQLTNKANKANASRYRRSERPMAKPLSGSRREYSRAREESTSASGPEPMPPNQALRMTAGEKKRHDDSGRLQQKRHEHRGKHQQDGQPVSFQHRRYSPRRRVKLCHPLAPLDAALYPTAYVLYQETPFLKSLALSLARLAR